MSGAKDIFRQTPVGWVPRGGAPEVLGYPRPGLELRLIERLVPFDGRDVLEIGCGTGRLTLQYADRARNVVALDPSKDDIAHARAEARRRGLPRLRFLNRAAQGGFSRLGRFDVALFSWSL